MYTTGIMPSIMTSLFRVDMGDQQLAILFTARPQLPYAKPLPKNKCRPLEGFFDGHRDYLELFEQLQPPKRIVQDTKPVIKKRNQTERLQKQRQENRSELQEGYNPFNPEKDTTENPIKTIFVGHLDFKTTEETLRKEFQVYGTIVKIRLVKDIKTDKSRGYAFIEFERKQEFKRAYKNASGKRIDGKKIVVDYERGRTQKNWRPTRLGGGIGKKRFRKERGGVKFLRKEEKQRLEAIRIKEAKERAEREKEMEKLDRQRGGRRGYGGGGRGGRDRTRDRGDFNRQRNFRYSDSRRGGRGGDRRGRGGRGGRDGGRDGGRNMMRRSNYGDDRSRQSFRGRDQGGRRDRDSNRGGRNDRDRRDNRGDGPRFSRRDSGRDSGRNRDNSKTRRR